MKAIMSFLTPDLEDILDDREVFFGTCTSPKT